MEPTSDTVEEPTLQHKKHIEGRQAAVSAENVFGILSQDNASPAAVNEPALQHKKRVERAPISLSRDFFSAPPQGPEFTLLGQQDKFASNVCYQPKQSYSEEKIYKNRENLDNDAPPNKQLKMQKRIKPLIKERHPPNSRSPPGRGYRQHDPDSPPPAPRGHRDNLEIKEAMKDKDLKDVLGGQPASGNKPASSSQTESSGEKQATTHQGPVEHRARRDDLKQTKRATVPPVAGTVPPVAGTKAPEKAADPTGASCKPQGELKRPLTSMNASVQTNVKKGVTIASHEAPADYSLKYKAGVAPPRPLQRVSEYQKQFQWKNGLKTSPLLAAEQIVYNSQASLGPYKSDGVPKMSEYGRQFQPWKPTGYHSDINLNTNNSSINLNTNNSSNVQRSDRKAQKKTVVKRSKSAGAVPRLDKSFESDFEEKAVQTDAPDLRDKLKKTHRKIRHTATEYRANFKSPIGYSYENGAWKGAYPAQLNPDGSGNLNNNNERNNNNNNDDPLRSSWYAEVIELRRRAEEYRKRAQGTHFSREHLVQLMAKQTECWDTNSVESSTVGALNLEAPTLRERLRAAPPNHYVPVDNCSHEATDGDLADDSDVDDAAGVRWAQNEERKKRGTRKSRKMVWLEEQKQNLAEQSRSLKEKIRQQEDSDDGDLQDAINEGRLHKPPTRQQHSPPMTRHHLDRTTPAVGGAILACPPSKSSKMIVTSRSGDCYVTASDEFPAAKPLLKSYKIDQFLTMPTLGLPSGDTHLLRDDSADLDQPLKTQFVISPPLPQSDEDKENENVKRKPERRRGAPKPSYLTTIKEGFGETFQRTKPSVSLDLKASRQSPQAVDEDVLSESLLSVASSSSLASEILERTKRRQEFWNETGAGR